MGFIERGRTLPLLTRRRTGWTLSQAIRQFTTKPFDESHMSPSGEDPDPDSVPDSADSRVYPWNEK